MSDTVTGLDLERLEDAVRDDMSTEIALRLNLDMGDDGNADFVADVVDAAFAAVPTLLAAARANARIEAMVAVWEADEQEHLMRFGQHIPCSLATLSEAVRAALGTEQEGQQ